MCDHEKPYLVGFLCRHKNYPGRNLSNCHDIPNNHPRPQANLRY